MKNLVDSLVAEEMKKSGGNVSRVARALGLNYATLKNQLAVAPSKVRLPLNMPDDIRTLARPGLEQFAVAAKRAGDDWPYRFSAALQDAQAKYDAGTHEMCQSTTREGWVVQYLIPRRVKAPQRFYFSSMVSDV